MNKKIFKRRNFLIGYYLLFVFAIVLVSIIKPALNWDMIGYVASVEHFEISNPIELHNFVFSNLKDYVSPDVYFVLTDRGSPYRIDMSTNPYLFYQQLPFYEIRLIYTFSILLMTKLGLNIFTSTYVVSIISSVLGTFLILFAIKDKIYIGFLYVIPFFLMFFGIFSIAKISTPDAMVFLSLSVFIYLFSKEKITSLLFVIPFFVLVRTDMIIFNFLALIAILFLHKDYRIKVLLSFIATIILYLSVNVFFNNYGWSTVFLVTLIKRISNPADVILTVSVLDYLHAFARGIRSSLYDSTFEGFVSIVLISLILMKVYLKKFSENKEISFYLKKFSENKEISFYFIIPIIYILVHFILFPVTWDRFFIGFYTMFIISILLLLSLIVKKYEKNSTL